MFVSTYDSGKTAKFTLGTGEVIKGLDWAI
jgi:FKBP-type peptidyl-prolyl cis-trans isomerase